MKIINNAFLLLICVLIVACGGPKKSETESATKPDSQHVTLDALNKKIAENPKDPKLYDQRAAWYLQNKDPDKALSDVNKAITLDPKNSAYMRTLSDVFFATGKLRNCLDALNKACELNPNDAEALLKLAELYFYQKDYKRPSNLLTKPKRLII